MRHALEAIGRTIDRILEQKEQREAKRQQNSRCGILKKSSKVYPRLSQAAPGTHSSRSSEVITATISLHCSPIIPKGSNHFGLMQNESLVSFMALENTHSIFIWKSANGDLAWAMRTCMI